MRPEGRQLPRADEGLACSTWVSEPAANFLIALGDGGDVIQGLPVGAGVAEQDGLGLRSVFFPFGGKLF